MANWRVQVASYEAGALPEDQYVNTLYFTGDLPSTTAMDSFMTALNTAWNGHPIIANRNRTIKIYNMGDPKPRPIIRSKVFTGSDLAPGPQEVALCLSYYSTRNLPRFRGRIYLGPFAGASVGAKYPSATVLTGTLALGQAIQTAGAAITWIWSLHSVKDNTYLAITDLWVDNAWDTQRRRGAKATTRSSQHL